MSRTSQIRAGASLLLALAGVLWAAGLRAQPAGPVGQGRWLFIFDTSSDMKRRLPAVLKEADTLLTAGNGEIRAGDSIGVWTFDQALHHGEFPLVRWNPDDADDIAAGMNKFVGDRHFTGTTRFEVLQPFLNQVMQDSPRLTALIFCDGEGKIQGTPYDDGINRAFQERQAGQKQKREPFVIVLRAQRGQYVGCVANYPPGMMNFPPFPALPAPPPPVETKAPAPPPPPAPPPAKVLAPLMMIGTNFVTSWPSNPAPAAPAREKAVVRTNLAAAPPVVASAPTNLPPVAVVPVSPALAQMAPPAQTNPVPIIPVSNRPPAAPRVSAPSNPPPANPALTNAMASPENPGSGRQLLLVIGAVALVVAVALGIFAFTRARRADRGSLISRAMRKD